MYLINTDHLTSISTQNWEGYSTASTHNHIPMYLENTRPGPDINYQYSFVYIKSPHYPGEVMCLARNYYGVFWKSLSSVYPPYCSWTLKHSTDYRKRVLEYGDQFVLNNVNWPSFAMGLDTTGNWVMAVYEGGSEDSAVVWQLKKI